MFATSLTASEFGESWQHGDESARWRSTAGHTGARSGSSLLKVDPGRRLPRHTDSAGDLVVVYAAKG